MRLFLILSVFNSVQAQIQPSPTRQNLSLPGLEIEHNAKSGFYFQRAATLYANQRFAHIVMILDLNFFESRKQEICDSYLQFRSTVNSIKKYRVVGQSATSIESNYADNIITLLAGQISQMTRECLHASRKISFIKDLFSYHESIPEPPILVPAPIEKRQTAFILGVGATLIGSLLYGGF